MCKIFYAKYEFNVFRETSILTKYILVVGDKDTKICGKANIMCYRLAAKKMTMSESVLRSKCNCMPTCNSIEYSAAIERFNLDQMVIKNTNKHLKE